MDKKSVLSLILVAILLLFVPAAAAAGGMSVDLTADKSAYTASDPISVTLSIRNDEAQNITGMTVALTAPSGYEAAPDSQLQWEVDVAAPEQVLQFSTTLNPTEPAAETEPSETEPTETEPVETEPTETEPTAPATTAPEKDDTNPPHR